MPKICHYEILNVESTANDDDLKKAYKKAALKWHPDKNIGDDEAHSKFIDVKEAYRVLSDRHERAWYDKHKDQILSQGSKEVNIFDVFPYFSASCFKGFDDSENGFYSVYRTVFENISSDDEAVVGQGNLFTPSFGTFESSYEDEVEPFYNYWSQYSTKIQFLWVIDIIEKHYPRKVRKAIEKDNIKKIKQHQMTRNEEVRNLVEFVKKRDKRVKKWIKETEEKKKEKILKVEESRQEKIRNNVRLNESYQECEWSKFSALESELENVEAKIKEQFKDNDDNSDYSDNSEENELKIKGFFCLPCQKMFKSEKAFENHEGSKKHKQNAAALASMTM